MSASPFLTPVDEFLPAKIRMGTKQGEKTIRRRQWLELHYSGDSARLLWVVLLLNGLAVLCIFGGVWPGYTHPERRSSHTAQPDG
jgi:hypothetical protein